MQNFFLRLILVFSLSASCFAAKPLPSFLRISLDTEPTTLDWLDYQTIQDRFVMNFIMRGLLTYDTEGRLSCNLCESYTVSSDGKIIQFKIRKGIRWSDQKELHAKDFVETWARHSLSQRKSTHLRTLVALLGGLPQVKTKSDLELEFTLKTPHSYFLHFLTLPLSFPSRKGRFERSPVLGPYEVAEWNRGQNLTLEKNPTYDGMIPVYRVRFEMGTHESLFASFRKGKIDVFSNPTTEELLHLEKEKTRVQVSPTWATRLLWINTRRLPGSDISFRRAILHAMDRDRLPGFLENGDRMASSLFPPGLDGFSNEKFKNNPDLAQSERHRAFTWPAWIDVRVLCLKNSIDEKILLWLTKEFEKIHVRPVPICVHQKDFSSELEKRDYDLVIQDFHFETASEFDLLRGFSEKLGLFNPSGFRSEITPSLSKALETQLAVVLPLSFPQFTFLIGPRVGAFGVTPFGDPDLLKIDLK